MVERTPPASPPEPRRNLARRDRTEDWDMRAATPPASPAEEVDAASPVREQIHGAIRAFTSATVAEADAAALAIIRIVRNAAPRGVTWPPKGYDREQPGGFGGPTGAD